MACPAIPPAATMAHHIKPSLRHHETVRMALARAPTVMKITRHAVAMTVPVDTGAHNSYYATVKCRRCCERGGKGPVLISRSAVTSAGSPSMGISRGHVSVGRRLSPGPANGRRYSAISSSESLRRVGKHQRQYQADRGRPHGSLFDADLHRFARADPTSKQI
jgi:hypothetical protein